MKVQSIFFLSFFLFFILRCSIDEQYGKEACKSISKTSLVRRLKMWHKLSFFENIL
jgi:hypothetical protein